MKKEPNKKPEKAKGGGITAPISAPKPKRKVKVESVPVEVVPPTPVAKVRPPKKEDLKFNNENFTITLNVDSKEFEEAVKKISDDYEKQIESFNSEIKELQSENEQLKCFCDAANYVKGELESAQSKIVNASWYKLLWMRIKGEI